MKYRQLKYNPKTTFSHKTQPIYNLGTTCRVIETQPTSAITCKHRFDGPGTRNKTPPIPERQTCRENSSLRAQGSCEPSGNM